MCFAQNTWKFKDYPKHHSPPAYRDLPVSDIDAMTQNADSRYYPTSDQRSVEDVVLRDGTYARTAKPNTIYKVNEFPMDVGASDGRPSRWVKVESTNGEYHGRPISEQEYRKLMNRVIPCCE